MNGSMTQHNSLKKLLLMFAVIFPTVGFSTTVLADEETETRQQLEQITTELEKLRTLLGRFKKQRSELQNTLQKSEVDIGAIQRKVSSIQRQLNEEQVELASLQKQRKQLNTDKEQQQKYIEQQIIAAYQVGQQKKIKVLLNQEQPEKISRTLTYYDYFNQARSEQIDAYADIISTLNTIEPKILTKTRNLSRAKVLLSNEHDKLLSRKHEREKSLAKINSAILNNDQRLKKMNKDRAELEQLLAAVEQTIANINVPSDYKPFGSLKGKLPWPVTGKPSNRFGNRRNNTALRWQGLAISATEGSQVEAIHYGRIVFADWLRGSGLLVIIDHGDGYMSLYAHNQSLLKEPGDWVHPGDIIATVGNSGGQQSANLYFEIRHNGKPTDPRRWCKRV
jgi:septal ring factor EnvC (AmiA/AmiB activator)